MGLRYRKSIKICKGVRVNFSKSGVSYSFGGKGATVNVSKKGVRTTLGIPGTGLSYSTFESHNQNSAHITNISSSSQASSNQTRINLHLDDNGKMTFSFSDGRIITDPAIIRKITATPQYKAEKSRMEAERQKELEQLLETKKKETDEFLNLHRLVPMVASHQDFVNQLNALSPQKYERKCFSQPYPTTEIIRQELEVEAQDAVKTKMFWKKKTLRQEYINERLTERTENQQKKWKDAQLEFELQEDLEEQKINAVFLEEYEASKQIILEKINGRTVFVQSIIDAWISECSLPVEININYFFNETDYTLFIDLDLPEIEDLPSTELVRLASGKLKEKSKTQKALRVEYATLVYSLAIFIAANLMNLTPVIHNVVLSGYTQRRNVNGDIDNEYIISIKFARDVFEKTSFQGIDPIDFCMQFENRCKLTSTMLFKAIEPYG